MELEKYEKDIPEATGDPEKQSLRESSDSSLEEAAVKRPDGFMSKVSYPMEALGRFCERNQTIVQRSALGAFAIGYLAYFMAAVIHDQEKAVPLIALTGTVLFIVCYENLRDPIATLASQSFGDVLPQDRVVLIKRWLAVLGGIMCIVLFVWIIVDVIRTNPQHLQSLFGIFLIIFISVIFSKHPSQISWRPVLWGILFQFILALIVLRTTTGYEVINWFGGEVAKFMSYTDAGSRFVFLNFEMHIFAFRILPMVIFFSTVTNVLYYLGVMQWFIGKLAFMTTVTLGVSAIESTVAVANILVGMTEAPLCVRPYLERLTKAEIHSIMCSGLASVAFSAFGAYIGFKVDSVHLLTAMVMTAPAGLVISRLLYPETEKSEFDTPDALKMEAGEDRNVVEAAARGASLSISLVANIAANLIAFIALVTFIDVTLKWFASFVGYDQFGFQELCGYIFVPVAFAMGVEVKDCMMVGELIGVKTFVNEFVAYQQLGKLIENRHNGVEPFMLERSEAIATHALCGFCNVGSLGIIIGGLGAMMPSKKAELADMAVRALIGGMLACFMTGSIAGMLFKPSNVVLIATTAANATNTTMATLLTTT